MTCLFVGSALFERKWFHLLVLGCWAVILGFITVGLQVGFA